MCQRSTVRLFATLWLDDDKQGSQGHYRNARVRFMVSDGNRTRHHMTQIWYLCHKLTHIQQSRSFLDFLSFLSTSAATLGWNFYLSVEIIVQAATNYSRNCSIYFVILLVSLFIYTLVTFNQSPSYHSNSPFWDTKTTQNIISDKGKFIIILYVNNHDAEYYTYPHINGQRSQFVWAPCGNTHIKSWSPTYVIFGQLKAPPISNGGKL